MTRSSVLSLCAILVACAFVSSSAPLHATELAAPQSVDQCRQTEMTGYRETIIRAFTTYQNSLFTEWNRQVEFRLRAATTPALRSARSKVLNNDSKLLREAFLKTKSQLTNAIATDVTALHHLLEQGAESTRAAVQTWTRKPSSFSDLERRLAAVQNDLLRYANAKDKATIKRVWSAQRAASLKTFMEARLAARQNLAASSEACSEEVNEETINEPEGSDTPPTQTNSSSTAAIDPNDNSDAAHPELDIMRPENQNQLAFNRIADDPRYHSAKYGDPGPTSAVTGMQGMMRGCVGTFVQTNTPRRGTLIKGSASSVYYYASNGNRYIFPSAMEIQSWYGAKNPTGSLAQLNDTRPCRSVVQVPDSVLATIPIRGNVSIRPNTYILWSDAPLTGQNQQTYYIVDRNRTLRPIAVPPRGDAGEVINRIYPMIGGVVGTTRMVEALPEDRLRQDYTMGAPFTVISPLPTEPITIEQELGI